MEPVIGKRFGKLVVKKQIGNNSCCECDCGRQRVVASNKLIGYNIRCCGCSKRKDLTNKIFGNLVVQEYFGEENKNAMWTCLCSCGNVTIVSRGNLQSGHTKSCGCLKKIKGSEHKDWKGHGGICGRYWCDIQGKAVRKNKTIDFDLKIEDAWELFEKQRGRCALTDKLIYLPSGSKGTTFKHTASLDRIDSNLGYTLNNVQWVHKTIQFMKMNIPNNEFIENCKLVARKATAI